LDLDATRGCEEWRKVRKRLLTAVCGGTTAVYYANKRYTLSTTLIF
jgi:hypothetical protein